jgi:hypothetical protein
MNRDQWTFRYNATQLAEATRAKIDYHNKCLEFWDTRREQLIAEIRADGLEVNEKTVLRTNERASIKGRDWTSGGDVMIRNDLRKSLEETYQKLSYHTVRRDQYNGWLQAFTDNPENFHELDMDDWQFFHGKDVDPSGN